MAFGSTRMRALSGASSVVKTIRNGCCFGGSRWMAKNVPSRNSTPVKLTVLADMISVTRARIAATCGSVSSTDRAWAFSASLQCRTAASFQSSSQR